MRLRLFGWGGWQHHTSNKVASNCFERLQRQHKDLVRRRLRHTTIMYQWLFGTIYNTWSTHTYSSPWWARIVRLIVSSIVHFTCLTCSCVSQGRTKCATGNILEVQCLRMVAYGLSILTAFRSGRRFAIQLLLLTALQPRSFCLNWLSKTFKTMQDCHGSQFHFQKLHGNASIIPMFRPPDESNQ